MLTSNYLKEVDLTDLANLKTLNCAINNLEELNLEKNIALETLICYENFIKSLNINHLKDLEYLYCYRNFLEKLDCSNLKKLKEIYCAHQIGNGNWIPVLGFLTYFGCDGCKALEDLDCAENELKELNINNLPELKTISCRENMLKKLAIANCDKLSFLDFSIQSEKDSTNAITELNINCFDNLLKLY